MRITCPNCNAQYEVGDDLIPSEGRDVQCSNCGTTWFQAGRARTVTAAEERAVRRPAREGARKDAGAEDVAADPDTGPSEDAAQDAATPDDAASPEDPAQDATLDDSGPDDPDEAAADFEDEDGQDDNTAEDAIAAAAARAAAPSRPRRPAADDATLDILREEREREERLRRAATAKTDDALSREDDEPQPDPEPVTPDDGPAATSDDEPRARAETERARLAAAATTARSRGAVDPDDDLDPEVAAEIARTVGKLPRGDEDPDDLADGFDETVTPVRPERPTRRALLPDIEEINSSLRPDERAAEAEAMANAEADAPEVAKQTNGFRIGFLLVCALVLVAVCAYVFADQIVQQVPALAGPLADYVAFVDEKRVALATAAEALTEQIAPDTD